MTDDNARLNDQALRVLYAQFQDERRAPGGIYPQVLFDYFISRVAMMEERVAGAYDRTGSYLRDCRAAACWEADSAPRRAIRRCGGVPRRVYRFTQGAGKVWPRP